MVSTQVYFIDYDRGHMFIYEGQALARKNVWIKIQKVSQLVCLLGAGQVWQHGP